MLAHIQGAEIRGFVLDMTPREVLLSFPDVAAPAGFFPGRQVTVRFWSHMGVHNAGSTILRVGAGPHVTIAIERFQKYDTVQKRRYFRVMAGLALTFDVTKSDIAESQGKQAVRGATRDISAGGLSMDTQLQVNTGDRVNLAVSVPRSLLKTFPKPLTAPASVVRVQEIPRGPKTIYCVSVEYRLAAENQRDRWVQLTFHLQRSLKS